MSTNKQTFATALNCCGMVDLIQEDAVFKGVLMTAASYGVTKDILAEALNKDPATCNTYLMGQAVAPSDERMRVVDALFNTLML